MVQNFLYAWDDVLGDVSSALVGNAVWTLEQIRDTGFIIPFLRHDQDDYINMKYQFPHRIKIGTEARLHVHAIPEALAVADTNDNVYWSYAWNWSNAGEIVPALTGWTTGNINTKILPTDQFASQAYPLLTMTKATSSESSILRIKLTRLGTNALDTYNVNKGSGTGQANFGIDYFDLHVQVAKQGSILEFANK